jgi:CRISPR-associated protein Csd2
MIHTDPSKRHDFVFLFDVRDGNPNGDPDAGNLPRIDPETMHGLVTDVCLKRKIRDYVATVHGMPIFIQSRVALNSLILDAFRKVGFEPVAVPLTEEERDDEELLGWLRTKGEAGLVVEGGQLLYSGGEALDVRQVRQLLLGDLAEENQRLVNMLNSLARRLAEVIRHSRRAGVGREVRDAARDELCRTYYDIRMFGAVLSVGLNAGQVRGPVQLTFARSLDPIVPLDLTITRQARTTGERLLTGSTEMGRKPIVPYGLYRAHGFFNPLLAASTGVSRQDLDLLWEALERMFDHDRSAARGEMSVRGLWVFTHDDARGSAPAHRLFDMIQVRLRDGVKAPRSFRDYEVTAPPEGPLEAYGYPGVTLKCLVQP